MIDQHPSAYFAATYKEAREKFLSAVKDAAFDHWAAEHPTETGRDGETLAMDIAVKGPSDAKVGLVIVSATHGVEGFCGSGVQVGLIRDGTLSELAKSMRVIVVHGHNPYGFSWLRRVNEDNVDMNRNYLDHSKPRPENKNYSALHKHIAPTSIDAESMSAANAALREFTANEDELALQAAISFGQYEFPDGLYFGGTKPTWSNVTFRTELQKACKGLSGIGLIDFHTGLGPSGHGEIISEYEADDPREMTLDAWFDGDVALAHDGSSVSSKLIGTLDIALDEMLEGIDVTACVIEFGTRRIEDVFAALRYDNWLHIYGDLNSSQADQIKADIRAAFYPDTDEWKEKVWKRSVWAVNCIAKGLAG